MNTLNFAELCFSYMVYIEDYRTNTDLIISLSVKLLNQHLSLLRNPRENLFRFYLLKHLRRMVTLNSDKYVISLPWKHT